MISEFREESQRASKRTLPVSGVSAGIGRHHGRQLGGQAKLAVSRNSQKSFVFRHLEVFRLLMCGFLISSSYLRPFDAAAHKSRKTAFNGMMMFIKHCLIDFFPGHQALPANSQQTTFGDYPTANQRRSLAHLLLIRRAQRSASGLRRIW